MARHWKAAVIGTGVVGEWHVRTIPKLPNATLLAVCDAKPDKAAKALEKNALTNIPIYSDVTELLRKHPDLDVVHVCTPSGDHYTPVTTCLEAGKNVICRKAAGDPPRPDRPDASRRPRRQAPKLAVHLRRTAGTTPTARSSRPPTRAASDASPGPAASRPGTARTSITRRAAWRGTWALRRRRRDHEPVRPRHRPAPVDRRPRPARVSAYAASRIHPEIEVEDTLAPRSLRERQRSARSWARPPCSPAAPAHRDRRRERHRRLRERPEDLQVPRRTPGRRRAHRDACASGRSRGTAGGAANTDVALDLHARNITHILKCWDEGRDAETSAPDARKAVAIILALYESARQGGAPIHVELASTGRGYRPRPERSACWIV